LDFGLLTLQRGEIRFIGLLLGSGGGLLLLQGGDGRTVSHPK
jgi:hypothetical protein